MRQYVSSGVVALMLAVPAAGQIEFGGTPVGRTAQRALLPGPPVVEFPEVDAAALMAEDAQRIADGIKGPYRFGYNHMTDLDMDRDGAWTTLPGGDRVWRIALHCPGAYSINFEFHDYVVPQGARVFVYNEQGDRLGGFTAESAAGHHQLGVTQIAGDRITIEYDEPAAVSGQGHLQIGQVTHAYRDILGQLKGLFDSGSCNNNVICPEGDPWREQIRSVAMITIQGQGICTGQLLNNCAQDDTPYFLTANHCVQGAGPVNNWVFRFKWESPTCTPTQNAPTNKTVSGSTLLVNSGGSDVALLELNSNVPASYEPFFSGWDKSGSTPTSTTCIHHPSGDIKKISFDNNAPTQGTFSGAACWHILAWDDGTTEPGSSGSGLWDQDHRLIGQLYGGQASCSFNQNDYFGRFSSSWSLLQPYLGSCGDYLDGQPSITGVAETSAPTTMTIAPNPTRGRMTITLPRNALDGAHLLLHDALGQLVSDRTLRAGERIIDLDMSGRPEGMYFLELRGTGERIVQRVAVQH
ncbi:MAG: trypsin-like peptidase domain-containing protein [Flavobacteriales bacterium]|nr:trypsin-like peptidase domain-containing protein [Flavobacteriales bacterium]